MAFPGIWRVESGDWAPTGGELRHSGPAGLAWLDGFDLPPGGWVAEVHLRFPENRGEAGVAIRSSSAERRIVVRAAEGRGAVIDGRDSTEFQLPTLGDMPFEPSRFHRMEVRDEAGGLVVRVDGVVVANVPVGPTGPAGFGLIAAGSAAFDAVSVAQIGRSDR